MGRSMPSCLGDEEHTVFSKCGCPSSRDLASWTSFFTGHRYYKHKEKTRKDRIEGNIFVSFSLFPFTSLHPFTSLRGGANGYKLIFMDRWGAQYPEDLMLIEELGLLILG